MGRWLLNTFPTWVLAVVFVGGVALLAFAGQVFVRRRFTHAREGTHNEVASVVLSLIAAVYGLVLGFVVVELYGDYQEAEETVQVEAAELSDILRLAEGLGEPVAGAIVNAVGEYATTVVDEEWESMREGVPSERAESALDDMFTILASYQPDGAGQQSHLDAVLRTLDDLHLTRQLRLDDARERMPGMLQLFIYVGAFVVIGVAFLMGLESARAQLTMVTVLGAILGFALALVILLDYPFSGDVSVPNVYFTKGELAQFF
jgi:NADH:ubiquinone oxidoreductase subunit 6 (subunit J)